MTLHSLLSGRDLHPAARHIAPPPSIRRISAGLAALFPLLLLGLVLVPWQQAALGTGRVVAYAPEDRRQAVEAPISGRIERWLVREGERVQAGQVLAEIVDIDPDRLDRLIAGQSAASEQLEFIEDQLRSYESKLNAERTGRDQAVAEATAKLDALQHERLGDLVEQETETVNAARLETLAAEGIVSTREAEVGRMKRDQAIASLAARDQQIAAQRSYIQKIRADGDAKVAAVQASVDEARAKLTEGAQKLLDAETKVARQQAQVVTAPRDGAVLALHGGPGGGLVKEGDLLVTLVPESDSDAVELWIDGNDLPLVREGQVVRLMFEGWPAIQLPGFPGASAGTYAGRLAFVDATDDGAGKFRVVVLPDPNEPAWPDAERLRQGVRAKGWVLLGRVRLGYELWRRVNGFPPLPSIEKDSTPLPAVSKKPRIPGDLK